MKKKVTSFGSMEILSREPRVEKMIFTKEGKPHRHDTYEYCYVLSGSGKVIGSDKERVSAGDFCRVPPGMPHWMVPEKRPFALLIFYS